MNFTEFQRLARLHMLGVLEEVDVPIFEVARRTLGEEAELCLGECRRVETALVFSLNPLAPRNGARERLLDLVRKRGPSQSPQTGADSDWRLWQATQRDS